MSDKKWGFEKDYAHKHMPNKWSTTSGFTLYHETPLLKPSFRRTGLPAQMEDYRPTSTLYSERPQTSRECMSAYGVHTGSDWGSMLRSPRNPFPGRPNRETKFVKMPSPCGTPRQTTGSNRLSSVPPGAGRSSSQSASVTSRRLQRLEELSRLCQPQVAVGPRAACTDALPETYGAFSDSMGSTGPVRARPMSAYSSAEGSGGRRLGELL